MKPKINKQKLLKRSVIMLLVLSCIGGYVAHKYVQKYGFDGIGEFVSVYRHNKALSKLVEPLEIQILISDGDYEFIKRRRDIALERGIQINDGEDNYVKCKIVENKDTVKGEMRLKGHMTDHLEGNKWSFRVKTKKKPVLGMTRFSLQAPGTRNYAYEWVYHQLLKNEDVIHLYYDFIHLKLNDKDLGIYAVEEHFGQHVLERNNRPKGAILRWNPNLYWEGRIDELQRTYLDEDYSGYSSSIVESYAAGSVEDDSILTFTYQKGAAMLEAFRRGESTTSETFDTEKMARFIAIIDLVGGHHSLDWSDVKFFYNSESNKIEPVGYESFSIRKTESIAGQRVPSDYEGLEFDYYMRLFSDHAFYVQYIKELERICDEKYMYNFMEKVQKELDLKLGVLAHEFPYRKFSFDGYFENIELIRHNLSLPKAFHAFKESATDSTILISVTPVSDFPIEILSLEVDGKDEYDLNKSFVLPPKARNTYAHYFEIVVNHDSKKLKNLKLKARIPGSKNIFEIEVFDLPSYKKYEIKTSEETSVNSNNDVVVHLNDSVSFFKNKKTILTEEIVFSSPNHVLKMFPGQQLIFAENGRIKTYGTVEFIGGSEEDEEIIISLEKNINAKESNINYFISGDNATMIFRNVSFIGSDNLIYANNTKMRFENCKFADISNQFMLTRITTVVMVDCASGSLKSLGTFDRSLIRIKNFTANKGDVFLVGAGSDFDVVSSSFVGYNSITLLNYNSNFSSWSSNFSAKETIASLNNSSEFRTYSCSIGDAAVGFRVDLESELLGVSSYELYKTESSNLKQLEERKTL